jgi:hypothetical protein
MMQTLQTLSSRLAVWMAADPKHGELWLTVGIALAIGCIALLTFEQMKARTAEQNW